MRKQIIIYLMLCSSLSAYTQSYTGVFYSPNVDGVHTDNWFNLVPNSGATASNNWNIYHSTGGSLFSVSFAATQPLIRVGLDKVTNFVVNGNVGIGTSTPAAKLHISEGGFRHGGTGEINVDAVGIVGGRLKITDSGNVGIGTANPGTRLHVRDGAIIAGDKTFDGIFAKLDGSAIPSLRFTRWTGGGSEQHNVFIGQFYNSSFNNEYSLGLGTGKNQNGDSNATAMAMTILMSGNVGIGTSAPDAKLSVKGTVHAQEVKVDLNGAVAPDYVFESSYSLPSLDSVQSYINQNKHLPEVPSAKEMEANGVNVGEMNMLLLKKVEELTLYMIEQNNKLQKYHDEIESLKKEIQVLKK